MRSHLRQFASPPRRGALNLGHTGSDNDFKGHTDNLQLVILFRQPTRIYVFSVRGRLIFSWSGGTSRTLNSKRTLNCFRGPGAPRGRLIKRTLKCEGNEPLCAQRGAKFSILHSIMFNLVRKFKAFRTQRGAKISDFGGRLIGLGVRGHLADA